MILETEIDGLLYSLDTDEQEATVIKCVDKGREGEVIIPASFFYQGIVYRMTRIGRDAFSGCTSLAAINIPEGVTSIGSTAFAYCSGLTSVTIPNSVTSIGTYAFLWLHRAYKRCNT